MSDFKLNWLDKLTTNKDDITIFDIGSHCFSDAINFKRYLPNSKVYAFEASSKNFNRYHINAVKNDVYVINAAMSDVNGECVFYNSVELEGKEWTPSGSLLKPTDLCKQRISFDDGEVVRCIRFDSLCDKLKIPHVDFVHMDVQGAEYKVVKGLGNYRPSIIYAETCEYLNYENSGSLEEFDNLMAELGYIIEERLTFDTLYIRK